MASRVYKKPYEECGDGTPERKAMKFGVLSVMYGTGSKTLANQLGVDVKTAEKFISDFFKEFTLVDKWIKNNQAQARKHGYVTMIYGRKRRLPDAKSRDKWDRLRAERQATNAIIQGSAAIQTKISLIHLNAWCKRKQAEGRSFSVVATVHDENLLYAPDDMTREELTEMNDIMLNAVRLKVPSKTDIEIGRVWGKGCNVTKWFND